MKILLDGELDLQLKHRFLLVVAYHISTEIIQQLLGQRQSRVFCTLLQTIVCGLGAVVC